MKRELILTARRLIAAPGTAPSQTDLRRAVSTADYAAFHALAELCADEIVGASVEGRATPEWSRVYRALDHGRSRGALRELTSSGVDVDPRLERFCARLDRMRDRRLSADYDPRPLDLRTADVLLMLAEIDEAVDDLTGADPAQRRALAFACVLGRRA